MAVDSPQVNDGRCAFADWIELLALTTERGVGSRADVVRLLAKQSDTDHGTEVDSASGELMESEILEGGPTVLADNVADELDFRTQTLRDAYPFTIHSRTETWSLEVHPDRLNVPAARIYVFCLLISALRDGRLLSGPIQKAAAEDFTRLFQEIAYHAATQLMGNGGVSFGWPRPDGSKFLEAVHKFSQAYGIGEAKGMPLPSSSHKEKDEGIDVIAWRSFSDKRPGQLLLLGQVASGNDWVNKPVQTAVARFLDWFVTRPANYYVPAIFIPFVQHHRFEPVGSQAYEPAVRDHCRRTELTFGLVVDRLRIVELFAAAHEGYAAEYIGLIDAWNAVAIDQGRKAA